MSICYTNWRGSQIIKVTILTSLLGSDVWISPAESILTSAWRGRMLPEFLRRRVMCRKQSMRLKTATNCVRKVYAALTTLFIANSELRAAQNYNMRLAGLKLYWIVGKKTATQRKQKLTTPNTPTKNRNWPMKKISLTWTRDAYSSRYEYTPTIAGYVMLRTLYVAIASVKNVVYVVYHPRSSKMAASMETYVLCAFII